MTKESEMKIEIIDKIKIIDIFRQIDKINIFNRIETD